MANVERNVPGWQGDVSEALCEGARRLASHYKDKFPIAVRVGERVKAGLSVIATSNPGG